MSFVSGSKKKRNEICGAQQSTRNYPFLSGILLNVLGKAKVHWTKTKHSGKNSRTVHYRAEEIYFNERILLFGTRTSFLFWLSAWDNTWHCLQKPQFRRTRVPTHEAKTLLEDCAVGDARVQRVAFLFCRLNGSFKTPSAWMRRTSFLKILQ